MEQIKIEELKDWITPYLTITGNHPKINEKLRKESIISYFRQLTIPNIFDNYALILHPYWIYDLPKEKTKENHIEGKDIENYKSEFPEEDYRPVKWIDFYNYKNVEFSLETAITENVEWNRPFSQMNNEMWPCEGGIDMRTLQNISETILKFHGDCNIELYYIFMATKNYDEDEMYKGKLSELISFLNNYDSVLTPSLIYDIEKKWAITSDFDLPFSIIGGEKNLIIELLENNQNEIYLIE
ncbi:hypothetical protein JSO59_009265 [Riemerella anatipestifer]|uniref:hypothetical protein n=1 Tax=Riemerella anatipestifer TaxID=34085 RepID=UPI001375167B|nr:hypothetical protein [Riemerella anatipestifer]MDY3364192.1 hypothetical protein [Riemerella anatipestifer]